MDQVGEHRTRWDKLEIMMESHQLMIKEQVRRALQRERKTVHTLPNRIASLYGDIYTIMWFTASLF